MTASFLTTLFSSGYPQYTDATRGLLKAVTALSNLPVLHSATATLASASTVYVNVTGGSFAFTKQLDSSLSDIAVIVGLSARCDTASRTLTVGVNDGTTDTDLTRIFFNTATEHLFTLGGAIIPAKETGAYTLQLRAKNSGTGTMTIDANDEVSVLAWEVLR